MGENLKKAAYAGMALATGAAGYFIGKYKTSRKIFSTTALGFILIMCAPRGFDLAEKYMLLHHDFKKQELYKESKKDSIDAVIELNYPEKKLTGYIEETLKNISYENNNLKLQYESLTAENEIKYKKSLDSINKNLSEQDIILANKFNEISAISKKTNTPSAIYSNNSQRSIFENIINKLTASNKPQLNHYVIDIDKSEGVVVLYQAYDNGSKDFLNISSDASLPINGGPEDGEYFVTNKGSRAGKLYPGFLAIDDYYGISGAGEYNQYIDYIKNGESIDQRLIRVPNNIYDFISQCVDTKMTLVNIHN